MFSKALFKQSCKANGTMWGIVTAAVCFMLACVMLISGNGSIGEAKNAIQDTIITEEVDAQLQKRALTYYIEAEEGLERFDTLLAEEACQTITYLAWLSAMPKEGDYAAAEAYADVLRQWRAAEPEVTGAAVTYRASIVEWQQQQPAEESYTDTAAYLAALAAWQERSPATRDEAVTLAYAAACERLTEELAARCRAYGYADGSDEAEELVGCVMCALNPGGRFDDVYRQGGEEASAGYDAASLLTHILTGDIDAYLATDERCTYRRGRAEVSSALLLASGMSQAERVEALIEALSSYGVTREKYESFGYTYATIRHMAGTAIVTYQGRLDYELRLLSDRLAEGELSDDAYLLAVGEKRAELRDAIAASFLSTLPATVSDALEEIGQADLYTLIVGSIFYKLAGLLLPIIYMIMASNNLIAGQVDSGSMAYVLCTSTRRSTVAVTQAIYLIGSLLTMFALTSLTGCICLTLVREEVQLTYGNLLLLNVGAFLVLWTLSGLCFLTSCVFDRSKRSMAIGGGLSIFALVAAMLGLFGSPVIPSVVRLEALNYFNYTTIISLFDVVSIINGTGVYLRNFLILFLLGVLGYALGTLRFIRKDLPL